MVQLRGCAMLARSPTLVPAMSPTLRRVLQSLLYEAIAIAFTCCFDRIFGLSSFKQLGDTEQR